MTLACLAMLRSLSTGARPSPEMARLNGSADRISRRPSRVSESREKRLTVVNSMSARCPCTSSPTSPEESRKRSSTLSLANLSLLFEPVTAMVASGHARKVTEDEALRERGRSSEYLNQSGHRQSHSLEDADGKNSSKGAVHQAILSRSTSL